MRCLEGVRVLELARFQAGPRSAAFLADMGADVIKVERLGGEELRFMGPFIHGMGVQFACHSRGKRSATLNLRHEKGKALLADLARVSDVVLENFRPGVLERMGFAYEALRRINPTIILCSVSGFGQYGPYSQRGAFDPTGQAMSGLAWETGRDVGRPIFAAAPVADRMAALHAAIGILGALYHRQLTGQGQMIDVSMVDASMALTEVAIAKYWETGRDQYRRGGSGIQCRDGWVTVAAATGPQIDKALLLMDRDDMVLELANASTETAREDQGRRFSRYLEQWAKGRTVKEVMATMDNLEIPSAPIQTIPQVVADPHFWERQVMTEMEVEEGSGKKMLVSGPGFKMSRTPPVVNGIPKPGQHNVEVYQGLLGLAPDDVDALALEGVIQ